jgi:hypothetical protein
MVKFYIQDSWEEYEGDIIISYCENNNNNNNNNNLEYEILSKEEISKLTYNEKTPIIADRDILCKMFKDVNTYDDIFDGLFGNKKTKVTFYELSKSNDIVFPKFIKSVETKFIDGMIIDSLKTLRYFDYDSDVEIYYSDIMNLKDEIRLFITSAGKILGKIEMIDYLFLEEISSRLITGKSYCIDVAFNCDIDRWIIIENNPIFSVGINDCNNAHYIEFVIDSWKNLLNIKTKSNTIFLK